MTQIVWIQFRMGSQARRLHHIRNPRTYKPYCGKVGRTSVKVCSDHFTLDHEPPRICRDCLEAYTAPEAQKV